MHPRQQGSPEIVEDPTDIPSPRSRNPGKLSGDLALRVREAIHYAVHDLTANPTRSQVEEAVRRRFRDTYSEWVERVPVAATRLDYIGRVLRGDPYQSKPTKRIAAEVSSPGRPQGKGSPRAASAGPLAANLIPVGPADRLRLVAGSRPEPSVFEPGRRPWMYLYNCGEAIAEPIELFMGPSGHIDSVSAIGPGEAAELRWPGPSYHPSLANPAAKGGIVHFEVRYRTNGEWKKLQGNLQLDDDGVPVALAENPNRPESRTTRIR